MRRAFSLVELLLAVFILGIGIIGISALFPVGIIQQRQATDDVMGPIVADNAMALLRLKLNPEWFGSFEDFGQVDYLMQPSAAPAFLGATIPGDWRWKRPGFLFADVNGSAANETGAIDIFSGLYSSNMLGGSEGSSLIPSKTANESPDGNAGAGGGTAAPVYGIPYNRSWYDNNYSPFAPEVVSPDAAPIVLITQGERSYPQQGTAGFGLKKPLYQWECMFRKFDGRVQVAVFVYRIVSAGEPRNYSVVQGSAPLAAPLPPVPVLKVLGGASVWRTGGADGNIVTAVDNAIMPNSGPVTTGNPVGISIEETWQSPGQWIVDEYNTVHRVVGGRRNTREGPVILSRPPPPQPPIPSLFGRNADGSSLADPGVRALWFLPSVDSAGNSLVPVFATVQEL